MPRAPSWDLIVIDEAHRSAGRRDRAWDIVHDDAAIPARRRLYMTATPRIMNSERHETTSMDDPTVFGSEVFRLSFADAIDAGLLADYRVVVSVVTDAEVAALTAESANTIVSAGGYAVPARMLASQIALLKACRRFGLERVITYHHRVVAARRFAETLLNASDLLLDDQRPAHVRAEAVDGTMSLAARRDVLRHLHTPAGRTVVVANARVLAEGVDVPELDGVMFADPRDSTTDVVQAVGRALRRGARSDKTATIVIPILLNQAETAEAALDGSEYATVWRVIRALRAHDERLADWLDENRVHLTTGDEHYGHRLHELPHWLEVVGAPVTPTFAAALLIRAVNAASSPWAAGYAAASAFHAEHGHLRPTSNYRTADGYRLGAWIANQRSRRKAGSLSREQIAALDNIGMVWNTREADWQEGLAHARAYRDAHGDLAVPTNYVCEDGFRLGAWLTAARNRHNQGLLSARWKEELESLGVVWHLFSGRWQSALNTARAFHAEHGHLDIPQDHATSDGFALGNWLTSQRGKYRKGKLTPAQIAALEDLGISWNPVEAARDRLWRRGYEAARAFYIEHGHLNVPNDHNSPKGIRLQEWVQARRQQRREGRLSEERIAELDQIGMIWDPYKMAWEEGLVVLRAFHAEHGHLIVPPDLTSPSGIKMISWVSNRRQEYRAGTLPAERIAALEELGFVWDPHVQDWRDGLADCRDFYAEHGHLNIPKPYRGRRIKGLSTWLSRRRKEYRTGQLAPDRAADLEKIGIIWDPLNERHQKALEALRAYHTEHGHLRVPPSYCHNDITPYNWIHNRRSDRRRNQLNPELGRALDEITPDWHNP